MPGLVHFMRCVGRAVLKNGVRALVSAVPFGEVAYEIASDAYASYRTDHSEADLRAELEGLAQVSPVEFQQAAAQAVDQIATDQLSEVRLALTSYLDQIPGTIRQSLRRAADPTGRTIPPALSLASSAALVPFLPQREPRFKPKDRPLPGVNWELVKLLGVGGFGEVWMAHDPDFDGIAPVALKFCLDTKARDRLLHHEAEVINRVMRLPRRDGIVPLQRQYLKADPPCLEYEFIDGSDLASDVFEQSGAGPMAPETATRIVLALARAVGQAHKLNPPVVHRDLKPANVLVRKQGGEREYLVTDFGIGGVVASQIIEQTRAGGPTIATSGVGGYTPLYASPQQKRGEAPDPRDDVHALGVIWYQLLIGDFSEGAPTGLDWADDLRGRGLDDRLVKLLGACVAGNPERRPPEAATLAERIAAVFQAPTTSSMSGQDIIKRLRTKKPLSDEEKVGILKILPALTRPELKKIHELITGRKSLGGREVTLHRVESLLKGKKDDQSGPEAGGPAGGERTSDEEKAISDPSKPNPIEQDMKDALEEARTKGSDLAYFERQAPNRIGAWKTAAQQGNPTAQWLLARCLQEGTGIEKFPPVAVNWLRKAADQGNAEAQCALGSCYEGGRGIEQNLALAVQWYRKAADQGQKKAKNALKRLRKEAEQREDPPERSGLRKKFWEGLLSRPKAQGTRHANITPGHGSYIAAGGGVRGLLFRYVVRQEEGTVDLYIDRGAGKTAENKDIFDRLHKHKEEIDKTFGGGLSWQRLNDKQACRIAYTLPVGGYRSDESKWPEIQDAMIDAMVRLEQALQPHLAKLKAEV